MATNPPNPPGNSGNPGNTFDPNALAQILIDAARQNELARQLKDDIEKQTSFLRNQKTLRSEILSLSKKLYEVSRDIDYLEDKELGTREAVLSIDKEINKARKAELQLSREIGLLEQDRSTDAQTLVTSLKEVVERNKKNRDLLNEQKDLSEKIRNNFGVKPFSLLAEIFEKIGGKASLLSTPFEKGAKAAREAAKESFLNNKKIDEQISLREELNKVINAGSSTRKQAEDLNLRDRNGNLLTGAAGRSAAISKLGNLPDLGSKTSTFAIGMSALTEGFKGLLGGLTGLLKGGWIGILVGIGKFFIDAMFAADKQITDIAKSFNISKDAARETRDSFFKIADKAPEYTKIQEGNSLLQKDIVESNLKLNELLGTSVNLATDLGKEGEVYATQLANASKFLGLSDEEQKGLIQSTAITGKEIDDIKNSVVGTTRLRKLETGLLVNERAILKDVLTASNAIKVSIKGGTESLTNAAVKARELGLSLSQVDKIADSLLNFEQSITSELEAELLTGQDLNLERARYFALTNDIEGLTGEIANNQSVIDAFAGNNRIAQAKIAQSLGMQREELANMVVEQQTLNKFKSKASSLDADTLKQLKESGKITESQYNDMKAGKGTAADYYRALKESGKLTEDVVKQLGEAAMGSLEAQDAQSKFTDALEKAKETFTRFVDGEYLDKFANFIARLVTEMPKILENLGLLEETPLNAEETTEQKEKILKAAETSKMDISKFDINKLQDLASRDKGWFGFTNEWDAVSNTAVDEARAILNALESGNYEKISNPTSTQAKSATGTLATGSDKEPLIKPKGARTGAEIVRDGIVNLHAGEVVYSAESVQALKNMADNIAKQNEYLAALLNKNYTPIIEMNGIKLNEAMELIPSKA